MCLVQKIIIHCKSHDEPIQLLSKTSDKFTDIKIKDHHYVFYKTFEKNHEISLMVGKQNVNKRILSYTAELDLYLLKIKDIFYLWQYEEIQELPDLYYDSDSD